MPDTEVLNENGFIGEDQAVNAQIRYSTDKYAPIDCSIQQEARGISVTLGLPGNPNIFLELDDSGNITAYVWPHEDADNFSHRYTLYQPRRSK